MTAFKKVVAGFSLSLLLTTNLAGMVDARSPLIKKSHYTTDGKGFVTQSYDTYYKQNLGTTVVELPLDREMWAALPSGVSKLSIGKPVGEVVIPVPVDPYNDISAPIIGDGATSRASAEYILKIDPETLALVKVDGLTGSSRYEVTTCSGVKSAYQARQTTTKVNASFAGGKSYKPVSANAGYSTQEYTPTQKRMIKMMDRLVDLNSINAGMKLSKPDWRESQIRMAMERSIYGDKSIAADEQKQLIQLQDKLIESVKTQKGSLCTFSSAS
jgi:hypothetical protein